MIDQTDVDRWAAIVARAYAEASKPRMAAADEVSLAKFLNSPLAHCLMLAIPPVDWGPHYINIELARWEGKSRAGPRLAAVNYFAGLVEMR